MCCLITTRRGQQHFRSSGVRGGFLDGFIPGLGGLRVSHTPTLNLYTCSRTHTGSRRPCSWMQRTTSKIVSFLSAFVFSFSNFSFKAVCISQESMQKNRQQFWWLPPFPLKLAPTSSVRRCQMFKENNLPYKDNPSRDEQLGGSLYGCRNDGPCGSRVTSGGNSGMFLLCDKMTHLRVLAGARDAGKGQTSTRFPSHHPHTHTL